MVDLALLQSVSYIAGAMGVCVAAIYYVMNLLNSNKMSKRAVVMSLINSHSSYETVKISNEVITDIHFKDYDDFEKKYGSDNKELFRMFLFMWVYHDRLGYLLKEGYVTPDTLFDLGGTSVLFLWSKFELVDVAWKQKFGESYLPYVKYLALEMVKVKKRRESGYVVPDQFSKYL
jgi:hypothetical protein